MKSKVSIKNNKINYFHLFCLAIIYFLSRLFALTKIPIFADEAIYIRWSQIIRTVETLRFIPLTDGKQPLYMWILSIIVEKINDPLFAGRLISIFAGFGSLIGLFLIANYISNYKTALIVSFLYIIFPFTFFFDRMALPDNLLSMFGIWSLFFTFLVSKTKRLDYSIILGIILGLAWLTKSPAIYFISLFLITYIFLNLKKIKLYDFYIIFVPLIISFIIYNILRLGPQFHMIALRNKDYIHPLGEILKHPLDPLKPHLIDYFNLIFFYISLPIIFAFFAKNKYILILCAWALLPVISNSAMAKVFTARYILYSIPPLILIISLGFENLVKKIKYSVLLFILFIPNLILIYNLYFKTNNLKLPQIDMGYLVDWTSGWGIKETSIYLKERSKEVNVIVGTEGYFGTLPDGLQAYTQGTPQLTIFGVGIDIAEIPEKLIDAFNHGDEVYILFNQSRLKIPQTELNKLQLISKYPKPDGDYLVLYKL